MSAWAAIANAFCPTGDEGGIDNSCSPNEGRANLKRMHAEGPKSMDFDAIDKAVAALGGLKGTKLKEAVHDIFGPERGDAILKVGKTKRGVLDEVKRTFQDRLGSWQKVEEFEAGRRKPPR